MPLEPATGAWSMVDFLVQRVNVDFNLGRVRLAQRFDRGRVHFATRLHHLARLVKCLLIEVVLLKDADDFLPHDFYLTPY